MAAGLQIVSEDPYADGVADGKQLRGGKLSRQILAARRESVLADDLGALTERELQELVSGRLETPPDYGQYPELEDLWPERLSYLRGLAAGAECGLTMAAVWDFLQYRVEIGRWWRSLNPPRTGGHCSGVLLVGPDGVLGGQSKESMPPPPPSGYRFRRPPVYRGLRQRAVRRSRLTIVRPRTGYVINWGTTNECGLGCAGSSSCSTWLDEPIVDSWPIKRVPLLRFARNVRELAKLYRRYAQINWGRNSEIFADRRGDAVVIEKSFRRIGVRRGAGEPALWCTEGHFQSATMAAYMRRRRLAYVKRNNDTLGADDLQYAHDCAVRFTHIGELCAQPWGNGLSHMRRVLTDHATFPRAVCRHAGPDTDPYDRTVTMESSILDFTHNRVYHRAWVPWQRFPCQVAETVIQYPPRPGD